MDNFIRGVSKILFLIQIRNNAGIAQLVEQATENRRVPSSNLGPGTFIFYKNGDKLALLRGCFFVQKISYGEGFRQPKCNLKKYKKAFS